MFEYVLAYVLSIKMTYGDRKQKHKSHVIVFLTFSPHVRCIVDVSEDANRVFMCLL
jgi:hypothetical protein